jgi:hypothetical protein
VQYIKKQLDRSVDDGEVRSLAVKLVSGSYDYMRDPRTGKDTPIVTAWGHHFRAPSNDGCQQGDPECEIGRIWDFVVANMRYTDDPSKTDTFATTKESLLSGGGDCDDMVIVFGGLLYGVGFPVAARVISTKQAPKEWVHIYPLAGLPKARPTEWIPLDATVKGAYPGWEYEDIAKTRDYIVDQ